MYLLLYDIFLILIGLFISFYTYIAAPKLPKNITKLFNNEFIKMIFIFIIAYKLSKNPFISVIVSIMLLIILKYDYHCELQNIQ